MGEIIIKEIINKKMKNYYKQRNIFNLDEENYNKCVAFSMGKQERLGKKSCIRFLSIDLIKEIILFAFYIDTIENIQTLKGHSKRVKCIIVYKENLISGSRDKTIRIWNTNGDCIKILKDHDSELCSFCLFKNYVISGDRNGNIFYWENILEGQIKYKLKEDEEAMNYLIEFNSDLISISWCNTRIWNEVGKCIKVGINGFEYISSICPLNNDYFFSGSHNKTIIKWNNNYELIKKINTGSDIFSIIIFNNFLISGHGYPNNNINLYDLELNFLYKLEWNAEVREFTIFEGCLFSSSNRGEIRIWNIEKREYIRILEEKRCINLTSWNKFLVYGTRKEIKIFG